MAVKQKVRVSRIKVLILSLICVLLAGILFFLVFQVYKGRFLNTVNDIFMVDNLDPDAKTGAPPGVLSLEKKPDANAFSYRISHTLSLQEDGALQDFMIQNVSYNDYLMVLEIAQEETLLYQSKYIAPGQYLDIVQLRKPLMDSGPVTAYIYLVDPHTLDLVETFEESLIPA